jgi:UPF0755 protein
MPRPASPRSDLLGVARLLLLLAILALSLRLAWVYETRYPLRAEGDPPVSLIVPPGSSAEAIGRQLHALGLVRYPLLFRVLVVSRGVETVLKAGEYAIEGPLSLEQIVDMMARGDVVRHDVTVPEGKNLADVAEIVIAHGIDAPAFLKAARDPALIHDLDPVATDLEGYLFPDTYDVTLSPGAPAALVTRMVQRFRAMMELELPRLATRGLNLRQVVTLASLVELETAQAEERPRIAAVFLNRLRKKMPLQTDPTVIYALRQAEAWDGKIHKRDLSIDSPYNTYRIAGLPPGPIASPGRESLRAVLDPASVPDLYFVSRNDGTHQFSPTLAEHNQAVERYQKRKRPVPDPPGSP